MSERYTRLYTLTTDLYAEGAPVIIMAGALLKDTQTNSVLTQLKIRNITDKKIKAAKISITPFDTAGNRLGDNVEFEYLDIAVWKNGDFGEKIPVRLPDNRVRSFSVVVEQVVFEDNSIWTWDGNDWAQVVRPKHLTEKLTSKELIQQYKMEYGNSSQYIVTEDRDIWICTCGNYCKKSSFACNQCGNKFNELKNIDYEKLTERCQERLKENKRRLEEEEKEAEELRKKKEITNKKIKKIAIITMPIVAVVTVIIITLNMVILPSIEYAQFEKAISEGDYKKALMTYQKLGDFKNSKQHLDNIWEKIVMRMPVSAGDVHTLLLNSNGTVTAIGPKEQCDVGDWNNIIDVSAGARLTAGLKSNGTVVAIGTNWGGQLEVNDWEHIIDIACDGSHVVGLKTDGTVVTAGTEYGDINRINEWKGIIGISAGYEHIVGLRADGTVVAAGDNRDSQCEVSEWTDIIQISALSGHTVGLKSDGTVVATGVTRNGQGKVENWNEITMIAAGGYHTVGLKSDGTVVATGDNRYGQCNVGDWTDIIAIAGGYNHTVGLRSDGTVVATGDNRYGQCNVSNWKDIGILK